MCESDTCPAHSGCCCADEKLKLARMMDRCQEDLFVRETLAHTKETLEHVKTELNETRERNRYLESVNEEVRSRDCCPREFALIASLSGERSSDNGWRPQSQATQQQCWPSLTAGSAMQKSTLSRGLTRLRVSYV